MSPKKEERQKNTIHSDINKTMKHSTIPVFVFIVSSETSGASQYITVHPPR